jgi:fimbrial chaperone protein
MRSFRSRTAAALAMPAFLALAGLASAAQFSLGLTRVHLGASHPVETVTLANQDAHPLSFEVQVKRWRQDDAGAWQLVPDEGLVVHPLILRVAPGESARLRVGSLSPTVDAEQAYRIELHELPDKATQKAGIVRMLARVSVPVFVQPDGGKASVTLSIGAVESRGATLVLHNTGTAYEPPVDGVLRVRDAAGKTVHEARLSTNYILAGARWPLHAKLPAGICARAASMELTLGDAPPIAANVAPGMRTCAP